MTIHNERKEPKLPPRNRNRTAGFAPLRSFANANRNGARGWRAVVHGPVPERRDSAEKAVVNTRRTELAGLPYLSYRVALPFANRLTSAASIDGLPQPRVPWRRCSFRAGVRAADWSIRHVTSGAQTDVMSKAPLGHAGSAVDGPYFRVSWNRTYRAG